MCNLLSIRSKENKTSAQARQWNIWNRPIIICVISNALSTNTVSALLEYGYLILRIENPHKIHNFKYLTKLNGLTVLLTWLVLCLTIMFQTSTVLHQQFRESTVFFSQSHLIKTQEITKVSQYGLSF